jgi:hypothetical protein
MVELKAAPANVGAGRPLTGRRCSPWPRFTGVRPPPEDSRAPDTGRTGATLKPRSSSCEKTSRSRHRQVPSGRGTDGDRGRAPTDDHELTGSEHFHQRSHHLVVERLGVRHGHLDGAEQIPVPPQVSPEAGSEGQGGLVRSTTPIAWIRLVGTLALERLGLTGAADYLSVGGIGWGRARRAFG